MLPHEAALALGAVGVVFGVAVFGWAGRTLFSAGEHPNPDRPTGAIVSAGPYRFSRNPLYLAMTLFAAGVALLVNSGWGLALVVPSVVATHYWANRSGGALPGRPAWARSTARTGRACGAGCRRPARLAAPVRRRSLAPDRRLRVRPAPRPAR